MELFACVRGPFANGIRDCLGLAEADADVAIAVAHDDEGGEGQVASALDDLCDALDLNHAFNQAGIIFIPPAPPVSSVSASASAAIHLELESFFPGGVCQCPDSAVVLISGAIEHDSVDAYRDRPLRNAGAHGGRAVNGDRCDLYI